MLKVIIGLQKKTDPSFLGAARKPTLDNVSDREDDMAHRDVGDDSQPVELLEELQVGLALVDQSLVRVEDEEGPPEDAEDHEVVVDHPDDGPGQDEASTEQGSCLGVLGEVQQQDLQDQAGRGQQAWGGEGKMTRD